jgi:hypothetical protein
MGTYVHHVPGRLRVKAAGVRDGRRAAEAVARVRALEGTREVALNPRSGSLVVLYDSARLAPETILDALKAAGLMEVARPVGRGGDAVGAFGTAVGKVLVGAVFGPGLQRSLIGLAASAFR